MSLVLPIEGVLIGRNSDTSEHPLDTWVDGIRSQSDEAFRHVYEATADGLVSFAFGMVSDMKTAEDIVQQAFVELVKTAPRFRGDGKGLRAWLYKSVRYGCLDEYRRRSRRPEIPSDEVPEPEGFHDPASLHGLDPALDQALSQLSRRHRTLVLLRHVVGLSANETASVMGMTRKAVYSATDRAEIRLRRLLEDSA
ncbi:MAG: RNA polymerase sigma factor [Acidimicrobiia bacterium]